MKVFAFAAFAFAFASTAAVEVHTVRPADAIKNEFITVFHSNTSVAAQEAHKDKLKSLLPPAGKILLEYNNLREHGFSGYAVRIDSSASAWQDFVLRDDSVVEFVTPNAKASMSCQLQKEATWGLARLDQKTLNIDGLYSYDKLAGSGVSAYIIDTGIFIEHEDFEGRAVWGIDMVDGTGSAKNDPQGHGTHVAGTVMSKTWGVAKKATAVAVRVLDADGSGSYAWIIGGIDWVAGNHADRKRANAKASSVANLSLGGGKSAALNNAMTALFNAGVAVAVASGNEAQDACNVSPASAGAGVLTVNAADSSDKGASFSNYGKCTDLFAPGVGITSTWIHSKYSTNTISGTSMASPHVAGALALLSAENDASTPKELYEMVIKGAADGVISGVSSTTPNKNLFNACSQ